MLCQNCGLKESTSIFMPPGETKIKYLCGACYRELNNFEELESLVSKATTSYKIKLNCKGKTTKLFGLTALQRACRQKRYWVQT